MKVPLTVYDFLRRGALVYADRQALVDEPGTAGSARHDHLPVDGAPGPRRGAGA